MLAAWTERRCLQFEDEDSLDLDIEQAAVFEPTNGLAMMTNHGSVPSAKHNVPSADIHLISHRSSLI